MRVAPAADRYLERGSGVTGIGHRKAESYGFYKLLGGISIGDCKIGDSPPGQVAISFYF